MLLSDKDINDQIVNGQIKIAPFIKENLSSASIDLRLDCHYLKLNDHLLTHISTTTKPDYSKINAQQIVIAPHSFILAATIEYIKIPKSLAAIVEGRSSIGRMGLFIQNAGLVSPGFEGNLTLELYNANNMPLLLEQGTKICQIIFLQLTSPAQNPYQGVYQHQTSVTGSRLAINSNDNKQSPLTGNKNTPVDEHTNININYKDQNNNPDNKILVAADHAGFMLKDKVLEVLKNSNLHYTDCGCYNSDPVDYPVYASKVAQPISLGKAERGILICGSGQGMCIRANRFANVRAGLCHTPQQVEMARRHNNINVLVLSANNVSQEDLDLMIKIFLEQEFDGGRHLRRVTQIDANN